MEPLLDMVVTHLDDRREIVFRGELDVDTTPLALASLSDAVDTAALVIVDLQHLAFIDRFGADALLVTQERARAHGHQLYLHGALDHVTAVLQSAGFDAPPPGP